MNEAERKQNALKHLQSRILTHYAEARMILEGQMPPPRTAIVYPTYVCNQNCVWCEYAQDNQQLRAMMPAEKLRQLMWDLYDLGVRGVEFCGGGEPTLHPALPALIRDMKARGLSVGVLTNGTRLFGELAETLVDCASYVRVGFDGATEEMVNSVKRPKTPEAGFRAVCENITNMIALRRERGGKVILSMKVVLDAHNFHEVEACVELAQRLGVDSIQFKAARLCESELSEEQVEVVTARLERLRERVHDVPIVGGVDKLNMRGACWLTPLQIMIDTLGDVFLCCYYRHRKEAHRFGNIFEEPLSDIWYGPRHREAIRAIRPAECNLLDCRFVQYNEIMAQLMIENDGQFEFI